MRIVITGGSGLLAMNWACHSRDKHDILLLTHNHHVNMQGVESRKTSLDDIHELRAVFSSFSPDVVVHTAGFTDVDGCEREPVKATTVNTVLASNVAQAAQEAGVALVHISTDHLFSGDKPNIDEKEKASPVNVYGVTKLNAEKLVLEHCPDALVVRTNFFGWGHGRRVSITDWIINSIESEHTIRAFEDVFFTPIFVDDLVEAIYQLIDKQVSGIVHVVSDERISKYDFALAVAEVFKLDKKFIVKSRLADIELFARRPMDMSISNAKVVSLLGRGLGSVAEGLSRLRSVSGRTEEIDKALLD